MSSIVLEAGQEPALESEPAPEAPVTLRRRRLTLPRFRPLPAALALATSVVAGMFWLQNPPAPQAATPPPASAYWSEVNRPLALYDLSNTEFGANPRLEAKRHRTGGGRVDTLIFGQLAEPKKPWLRLSLYRIGGEEPEQPTFFVEMARRAAESRLAIVRSDVPDAMPTRFGDVETADLTLETPAGRKSCVGFRFGADREDFRMSGIACGTAERPVDRAILYCTIDRLDLLGAGSDPAVRTFFAGAEAGRGKGCVQSRLTAAAAQTNWLDAGGKQPPLRATLQQPAGKARR